MDCPWSKYFLISPISSSSLLRTLEPLIVHISIMAEHHKASPSLWPYFQQPWSHLTILVALIGRASQRWAVWSCASGSRFPIHFVLMSTSHIFFYFLLRLIFLLLVYFSLFSFILESWTHAWLKLEKSENVGAFYHFSFLGGLLSHPQWLPSPNCRRRKHTLRVFPCKFSFKWSKFMNLGSHQRRCTLSRRYSWDLVKRPLSTKPSIKSLPWPTCSGGCKATWKESKLDWRI